jgi:DNA-binding MarR family transcriptional regulator
VTTGKAALLDQLEQEVGALLRRIRRVTAERARSVHDDLQVAAYFILTNVAETGPKRASAVVEEFGIDKGAVSRQVQQLCDLGFLVRTPDPADGRAMMLSVTDEGARRLARTAAQRRRMLDDRLAGWSDEELAAFVTTLGRYNRTLDS